MQETQAGLYSAERRFGSKQAPVVESMQKLKRTNNVGPA